jgi:hypothetical protein
VFPQRLRMDYARSYARSATPALQNQSFESTAGEFVGEWVEYSSGFNVRVDPSPANARTGAAAVQMFGRFDGSAVNNSGLHQELPAAPGQVWQLTGWAGNRPGDALQGANTGRMKIEFIDASGNVIASREPDLIDANSPESYRERIVLTAAPVGTVMARGVIEMIQRDAAGGSVLFDDVRLQRVPSLVTQGRDINLDGVVDWRDVDALAYSLRGDMPMLDFNGDDQLSVLDLDVYLRNAFNSRRGDANLDRAVNFADLLTLAQNYNRSGATINWSTGDFTADGVVNFSDLLVLASRYDRPVSGTELMQWQQTLSVPEPATGSALITFAMIATARLRRRDRASRRG